MMTQTCKLPANPREAAACCDDLATRLDAKLFQALSDPTRVWLLACLARCGRACSVNEVAACVKVDLSVVSRHLAQLTQAGVLEAERQGRSVLYRVRYQSLAAALRDLAGAIENCCPPAGAASCDAGSCCQKNAPPPRRRRKSNPPRKESR